MTVWGRCIDRKRVESVKVRVRDQSSRQCFRNYATKRNRLDVRHHAKESMDAFKSLWIEVDVRVYCEIGDGGE